MCRDMVLFSDGLCLWIKLSLVIGLRLEMSMWICCNINCSLLKHHFTYYNIRIPIETSSFIAYMSNFLQNGRYTTFIYHIKYIIQLIIIITYFSIALIYSSIRTCSVRWIDKPNDSIVYYLTYKLGVNRLRLIQHTLSIYNHGMCYHSRHGPTRFHVG